MDTGRAKLVELGNSSVQVQQHDRTCQSPRTKVPNEEILHDLSTIKKSASFIKNQIRILMDGKGLELDSGSGS